MKSMQNRSAILLTVVVSAISLFVYAIPAHSQEITVFASTDEVIEWLKSEDFWGAENHDEQLGVPHVMITGISQRWKDSAQQLPVQYKKEIFYRLMVPLVLHANKMVMERREVLLEVERQLTAGAEVATADMDLIRSAAFLLRVLDADAAEALSSDSDVLADVLDELIYKLDIVPAGLALGQAAYESGYGTSRFAAEGNALFGQWTYGGKGLVPEQQRKNLGDHRIAAFDWPFDSVRGYYINLMSHPAYEDFRRLRAEARATGKPLTSLALADGLVRYSERGQEYVDTLKGIIRVNGLEIADQASFRDEAMRFAVAAESQQEATELRQEIKRMRSSGQLTRVIERMRLE